MPPPNEDFRRPNKRSGVYFRCISGGFVAQIEYSHNPRYIENTHKYVFDTSDTRETSTLLWSPSATAFTPVLERMEKPEYKRLRCVRRSMVSRPVIGRRRADVRYDRRYDRRPVTLATTHCSGQVDDSESALTTNPFIPSPPHTGWASPKKRALKSPCKFGTMPVASHASDRLDWVDWMFDLVL